MKIRSRLLSAILILALFVSLPFAAQAAPASASPVPTQDDTNALQQQLLVSYGFLGGDVTAVNPHASYSASERTSEMVQSNRYPSWPQGLSVSAEVAVLLDAGTGTVLYGKNVHEKLYPASITKMLTALLAMDCLSLTDTVTVSEQAIAQSGTSGSNAGLKAGDVISVEDALYAMMLPSANEAANAIGEKIAGTQEAFAELMNQKAASLGCTDSHFANTNGMPDSNHYTSAYDFAIIARAYFANPTLAAISNTTAWTIHVLGGNSRTIAVTGHHDFVSGARPLTGVIGGKTGYTRASERTLVTGCEINGRRLICVVLKETYPSHYTDSQNLFQYGYSNFACVNLQDPAVRQLYNDATGISSRFPGYELSENGALVMPSALITQPQLLTPVLTSENTVSFFYAGNLMGSVQLKQK